MKKLPFNWCRVRFVMFVGMALALLVVAMGCGQSLNANYMVIELRTGIKKTLAAPPAGGWTDYHKTEAMVFRNLDDYWIGVFEVTQGQWELLTGKNPSTFSNHLDSPMRPVERVNWHEAREFCKRGLIHTRFEQKSGLTLTLPTEDQWARAATGGMLHKYSGSDNLDEVGWYDANSGNQTHVVGTKKPNGFGLYDMSGNVWEWCLDRRGSRRALRGGCWDYDANDCAVSCRFSDRPDYRNSILGFRVALVPSSPEEIRRLLELAEELE